MKYRQCRGDIYLGIVELLSKLNVITYWEVGADTGLVKVGIRGIMYDRIPY